VTPLPVNPPPGPAGPPVRPAAAVPRHRLHPLSPLLHSAKTLAVIIAALSVQGAVRLGFAGFVGAVLVVMTLGMGVSAISWLVTGYHIVGRELRVYDGVLVRRTRAIPLDRLQAVEVVRPLLARAFGLAELRLEVVGHGKTEAPLAYLTVADAGALRERLLDVAARAGAPAAAHPSPPGSAAPAAGHEPHLTSPAAGHLPQPAAAVTGGGPPAERHLHSVVNRDVLVSQLRTPPFIVLPLAIAAVTAQYWFGTGAWSLVVLASMLVAIIGVIQQPVRRILSDWHFRLARQESPAGPAHASLRLYHGLTEIRAQTVPVRRVQAVGLTWPLLWRTRRWLRVRIDVAGYAGTEQRVGASDQLLPVGDLVTARRLVPEVLPGVDPADLPLAGVPRRARWLAPLRRPVLAAALTGLVFATRDGRVTRELVIVPYARIQSVRVVQGPLQRQLGLATVHADTAGSLTATAHHRDLAEARALAAEITARARAARDADRSALGGGAGGPTGGSALAGGSAPAAGPPAFGEPDRQEGDPDVGPSDQHVDHPVLPGVDQGERHRQRVGGQQRPPSATHRPGEEDHHEQGESRVQ
jgi:putative membrane protein